MHIPDGFLSPPVWGSLGAVSATALGLAGRKAARSLAEERIPLMGVLGAFVFAAQMINVPVGPGSSGHLMGGMLLAALLGPSAALVVMACIVGVQCLLFQDGGLTALGANVFNMGIVPVFLGWAIYRGGERLFPARWARWPLIFFGAWVGTMVAAGLAAVQLSLSGTVELGPALVAMLGAHALIGIGEGAITVAVVRTLLLVRPDLLDRTKRAPALLERLSS